MYSVRSVLDSELFLLFVKYLPIYCDKNWSYICQLEDDFV